MYGSEAISRIDMDRNGDFVSDPGTPLEATQTVAEDPFRNDLLLVFPEISDFGLSLASQISIRGVDNFQGDNVDTTVATTIVFNFGGGTVELTSIRSLTDGVAISRPVPEPSMALLMMMGLAGPAGTKRISTDRNTSTCLRESLDLDASR